MGNEILLKSRSMFTAQAAEGIAVSVGSFCAGTQTIIDNTYDGGSENAQGATALDVLFEVTIAPTSGSAYADIYIQRSYDGSTFGPLEFLARSRGMDTAANGMYFVCRLVEMPLYCKLKWKAYYNDVDGRIKVMPYLLEIQ